MTTALNGREMRAWRGAALLACVLVALSGCTTVSLQDAAPLSAAAEAPLPDQTSAVPTTASGEAVAAIPAGGAGATGQAAASAAATAQGSARQTGQFPNLNIVPTPAAPQLTAADTNTKLAELEAARKDAVRGASGTPESNAAKLKKLAKTHAAEALKAIEGE